MHAPLSPASGSSWVCGCHSVTTIVIIMGNPTPVHDLARGAQSSCRHQVLSRQRSTACRWRTGKAASTASGRQWAAMTVGISREALHPCALSPALACPCMHTPAHKCVAFSRRSPHVSVSRLRAAGCLHRVLVEHHVSMHAHARTRVRALVCVGVCGCVGGGGLGRMLLAQERPWHWHLGMHCSSDYCRAVCDKRQTG